MDEELRQIERAAEADPTDLDLLGELARRSERAGWTFQGKSVGQHVAALISRELDDPDSFDPVDEDLEILQGLGHRVVPALVESFKQSQLATAFRAGLALGELGPGAVAAIPCLIEGLSHGHPLIRLHARWTLARLAPQSLVMLIERIKSESRRLGTLLQAVVYMGRHAESARNQFEEWASEGGSEDRVEALIEASDLLAGRGEAKIPQRIAGPSYWCWGAGSTSDLRHFDRSVWGYEVASVFNYYADEYDLSEPSVWQEADLQYPLEALKAWRPHDIVLHAPSVRLTHFDHDLGDLNELIKLESPNGRDFARGELFFAAEQALGEEHNSDAMGVSMDLQVPRKDCPIYFIGVDST